MHITQVGGILWFSPLSTTKFTNWISIHFFYPLNKTTLSTEPVNIFGLEQIKEGVEPLRLLYQRGSHYNAILNPYKPTVGLGLGLSGYRITDESPNVKHLRDAVRMSEDLEIEQTMFEDKLKTTDWEATNEAIEEQIARESYLQWCRDKHQAQKQKQNVHNMQQQLMLSSNTIQSSSTITSTTTGGKWTVVFDLFLFDYCLCRLFFLWVCNFISSPHVQQTASSASVGSYNYAKLNSKSSRDSDDSASCESVDYCYSNNQSPAAGSSNSDENRPQGENTWVIHFQNGAIGLQFTDRFRNFPIVCWKQT